jgi:uncharacterized membrane protein YeaQ/YmgE (transglycosylase-associated protein family)
MNFIAWIIFGALAGWIASILTGKNRKMGAVANIVMGIFGAFVGAGILNTLGICRPAGFQHHGVSGGSGRCSRLDHCHKPDSLTNTCNRINRSHALYRMAP